MIKSKIHYNWYLWSLFMNFLAIFIFVAYILSTIIDMFKGNINLSYILITCFFIFLELFLITVIKDFKYLIIDSQKNQLKYYSILRPFGSILKLDDFDNKIKTSEVSVRGQYNVIYLVKDGYTIFKISGLFYDNFKEIDSSIKLKRIYNYKFNWKLYLKLLFTGRIRITEE